MVRAYRLTREPFHHTGQAFSGEGAARFGGRWNPPGMPLAYAASSISLAALERLVHTLSIKGLDGLWLHTLELPENHCLLLAAAQLPADWAKRRVPPDWSAGSEAPSQAIGRQWLQQSASLALRVPSAVIPLEFNYLINSRHPDFARATLHEPQQFHFNERLRSLLNGTA
jgi:RES domain-containing protein